ATLIFDVTDGAVIVYTVAELDVDEQVEIVLLPNGDSDSELVTFVSLQQNKIDIGKKARVLGTLIAPNAEVHFSKGSAFKGAAIAGKVTVEEGVPFLHHNSTVSLPKAAPAAVAEAVAAEETIPEEFALEQNYPNPFNPSTVISFQLPVSTIVKLAIYNTMGQLVRTLANGEFASGANSVTWDATDESGMRVASGVYLYRLQAGAFVSQRKLLLMK
ncbi:MAG: FlgD immunoglobulin-like domain containing protein, partial [bacterium]